MRFEDHKVIPVIKINDANKAEALARALLDGGIAAAALYIVRPRADAAGYAGKVLQAIPIGLKEIAHVVFPSV